MDALIEVSVEGALLEGEIVNVLLEGRTEDGSLKEGAVSAKSVEFDALKESVAITRIVSLPGSLGIPVKTRVLGANESQLGRELLSFRVALKVKGSFSGSLKVLSGTS